MTRCLDNGELSGSDVESVNIGSQTGESLLGSIRADKGVDLDGIDIVELLQGLLDLSLVGTDVDDKDEGVVLLDLLHGALGVEGVDDDLVLIETGLMGNRLAWVFWCARELEGLGLVEGCRETDLADLVGVDTLQGGLSSSAGLLVALAFGGSTYLKLTHQQSLLTTKNSQYLLLLVRTPSSNLSSSHSFCDRTSKFRGSEKSL